MITPEITRIIKSKAKKLARQYAHLQYDDLFQEGILQVLEIQKVQPDASIPFIVQSIKHKFLDIAREANMYLKHFIPLSEAEQLEELAMAPNEEIETNMALSSVEDKVDMEDMLKLRLMRDYGYNAKEIKKLLNQPSSSYYKALEKIK